MAKKKEYDVVVAGGGLGGVSAAYSAAKAGASVLLVEKYGFLGGMATAGLVNPFMSYRVRRKKISSPVFNELLKRMKAEGALDRKGRIFDDEILKVVLDRMMSDAGADVLFHALLTGARVRNERIESARIRLKEGGINVKGKIFIDATGDGDLAAFAGCRYEKGRKEDGLCQPMTLCFRIGNIAEPEGADAWSFIREELNRVFLDAKEAGIVDQPRENILLFKTLVPGVYHFNTTRVTGEDGTRSLDLSRAEAEARRQAHELFGLFKAKSLRFANAWLVKTAAQIGVRETRRIKGLYTVTEEDVLSARKFGDGIARSSYPVDIHNPAGAGTIIKKVPAGDYYEVPYRALLPEGTENLITGSRCVSSTHEAHSSLRIMPVVSAIGEAAGRAAAKAALGGVPPSKIDGASLAKEIFR